jgi:hypothetical protein
MDFQMGGIDHQLLWLTAFSDQSGQNPVEHTKPAPANEAITDRLVRTIYLQRITLPRPIVQNKDDAAYNQPVIDAWQTM